MSEMFEWGWKGVKWIESGGKWVNIWRRGILGYRIHSWGSCGWRKMLVGWIFEAGVVKMCWLKFLKLWVVGTFLRQMQRGGKGWKRVKMESKRVWNKSKFWRRFDLSHIPCFYLCFKNKRFHPCLKNRDCK